MLRNTWIIIDKEPVQGQKRTSNYTIIPVDPELGVYDGDGNADEWSLCIPSVRNLDIGTHTDDELTPLNELYRGRTTDIAIVESTQINTHKFNSIRISVFGRIFGEIYFLMDPKHPSLNIKRGDYIMLHRTYDDSNIRKVYNEEDDDDDEDECPKQCSQLVGIPIFHPLYNLTTKQTSSYFERVQEDVLDDCCKMVVLSKTPTENTNYDIRKHLLINSRKFGRHISYFAEESAPEFRAEPGDKILLEKYWDKNTGRYEYRILSNLTVDSMRNKFLLNTK